jgi:hypothetical protein
MHIRMQELKINISTEPLIISVALPQIRRRKLLHKTSSYLFTNQILIRRCTVIATNSSVRKNKSEKRQENISSFQDGIPTFLRK